MILRASAAATLLLAAACSSSAPVRDCATDADCGAGNLCHQGACAANAPPTAAFTLPAAPTTHRVIALAGAATDPEGRPATLGWSIRVPEGGCAPDLEPTGGAAAEVVFWCPGRYEITAVPRDDLGAEGSPAVQSLEVTAATGAPLVAAGLALAATHRCDAAVPSCQVLGPTATPTLGLGASGTDPAGAALAWEWKAFPPEGTAGDPTLVVTFAPDAGVAQPTVAISNAGGAIAGRYRFRVRARNPDGLVGQAWQEATVANDAPSWATPAISIPHVFDGARYLAEADVPLDARDRDGDPLRVTELLPPAPLAGCAERFEPGEGPSIRVRIACPDPFALIPQTPRMLAMTLTDPNGGVLAVEVPVTILNRPPSVALAAASAASVDHRVEPCILAAAPSCFVADGDDPFIVSDPEGDPFEYALTARVAAGNAASRGAVVLDGAARRFRFETPSSLPLQFRSATGASGFSLVGTAKDALGGTSGAVAPLSIGNRPPIVREAVPAVSVNHSYDAATRRYVATANGALYEDPDGDPLSASAAIVSYNPKCTSATLDGGRAVIGCALSYDYLVGGRPPLGAFATTHFPAVDVTDGWTATRSSTRVTILDRPASVSSIETSVQACACKSSTTCWKFALASTGIPVPILLTDPDGDPALLTPTVSWVSAQPPPADCLPGWCYPKINTTGSTTASGTVAADTGIGYVFRDVVTTAFKVSITCSSLDRCCTP